MHVKLRMNLRRPRRKPKYSLATDSEQVPRGKGEKNRCERSEIVPEMMCLQGVGAGPSLLAQRSPNCGSRSADCELKQMRGAAPQIQIGNRKSKIENLRAIRDGLVTACLLLNESASYCQWRA